MEQLLMYYGQFMELSKANPIAASVLATGIGGGIFMTLHKLPTTVYGTKRYTILNPNLV